MTPPRTRSILILTAAASLFAAVLAGLARMGWGVGISPAPAMAHGPALDIRLVTGMVTGIAILLFAAMMIRSVRAEKAAEEVATLSADAWRRGFRWVWYAALGCFVVAGMAGVLFRYGMLNGFPHGLLPENVRHAHSHLMYFSWVTPAVMALIAGLLPAVTGRLYPRKKLRGLNITIASTFILGLLAFVPFLLYGYTVAEFGDRRLPISMIMAGFNVIPWYFFAAQYRRLARGAERTPVLRLFDLSILFLVLSSFGAWAIAAFRIAGVSHPFWDQAMIHVFLDLFSDGWLILALLGIGYHCLGRADGKRVRQATWLFAAGLPVAFVLTMPVAVVPTGIRLAASAGGLLMGAGLALHVHQLWKGSGTKTIWRIPIALLGIKAAAMFLLAVPEAAAWFEGANLRILYLHILLMGFVTLSLVYAAGHAWHTGVYLGRYAMTTAALILLASLVPLSGLWPTPWMGRSVFQVAMWVSILPVLAAGVMLAEPVLARIGGRARAGSPIQAV